MSETSSEFLCSYCSFPCNPASLFCEECKSDLRVPSTIDFTNERCKPKRKPFVRRADKGNLTPSDALVIVEKMMLAEGRSLEDFDFSVSLQHGGTDSAELTPWPAEDSWCVWMRHDLIRRGLMQSGGCCVHVNVYTGDTHEHRFP